MILKEWIAVTALKYKIVKRRETDRVGASHLEKPMAKRGWSGQTTRQCKELGRQKGNSPHL